MFNMKKIMLVFGLFIMIQSQVQSQRPVGPRPDQMPGQRPDTSGVKKDIPPVKTGPKAYGEVITKKAVSQKTLTTRNCNCQSVIPTNSNGTTLIKYKIK
jgi:hypothetical protein